MRLTREDGLLELQLFTTYHAHGRGDPAVSDRGVLERQPGPIQRQTHQHMLDAFANIFFGIFEHGELLIGTKPVNVLLHKQDIGFLPIENQDGTPPECPALFFHFFQIVFKA